MANEKPPGWGLDIPPPVVDRSKWAKIEMAKPIDPRLVIEAARAIRANPEIWSIFTSVKPDEWIAPEDGARIGQFVQDYFAQTGRPEIIMLAGMEKAILRSHSLGDPESIDDDVTLTEWLRRHFPSEIWGGT